MFDEDQVQDEVDVTKDDTETGVLVSPSGDVQTIAIEVLEGKWGQTQSQQIRKLRKQRQDVRAIMAEVRHLSS